MMSLKRTNHTESIFQQFLKKFIKTLFYIIIFITFTSYKYDNYMDDLIQFEPIFKPTPENISKYYTKYNLEAPKNIYFNNLLSSTTGPREENKITDSTLDIFPKIKFSNESKEKFKWNYPKEEKEDKVENENYVDNFITKEIKSLKVTDEDKDYLIKLADRESSFNPNVTNQYGYYGLYQFGRSALQTVGYNKEDFKDTMKQHEAALKLAKVNESLLKNILDKYENKVYKGVKITKNGIRAAAHLLGAGSVKDWFNGTSKTSIAKKGFVDGNGTHITEYLELFS